MVGVIIGIRCCQLGINNLHKLVLIMKNWHDDPKFGCNNPQPKSIEKYIDIQSDMVLEN